MSRTNQSPFFFLFDKIDRTIFDNFEEIKKLKILCIVVAYHLLWSKDEIEHAEDKIVKIFEVLGWGMIFFFFF